jgi:hypothetical protein
MGFSSLFNRLGAFGQLSSFVHRFAKSPRNAQQKAGVA